MIRPNAPDSDDVPPSTLPKRGRKVMTDLARDPGPDGKDPVDECLLGASVVETTRISAHSYQHPCQPLSTLDTSSASCYYSKVPMFRFF